MKVTKWICSECGQENEENFCTKCGTARNINDENTWICPKCGKKNYDLFCENCGTHKPSNILENAISLKDVTDSKANPIPIQNDMADENTWICPKCGKKNYDLFCENCGTHKPSNILENAISLKDVTDSKANPIPIQNDMADENTWICPKCGKKNYGSFCENCDTSNFESTAKNDKFSETLTPNETNVPKKFLSAQSSEKNIEKHHTQKNLVVPKVESDSQVETPKSDSKKIFFAGCLFALLVVGAFWGLNHFNITQEVAETSNLKDSLSAEIKSDDTKLSEEENSKNELKKNDSSVDSVTASSNTPAVTSSGDSSPKKDNSDNTTAQNNDNKSDEKPTTTNSIEKNNQQLAIEAFCNFHKNITERKLQDAYEIFSLEMQSQISYDGWAGGFSTTVSSTPSDIQIVSETDSNIVMTYNLQAVDNPGGIQNFSGTVVMVKVGEYWKIDDVVNKVK